MKVLNRLLPFVFVVLCLLNTIIAFSNLPSSAMHGYLKIICDAKARRHYDTFLSANSDTIEISIEGKDGNPISVGSVIRVAAENLKAYQIPRKGQGTYNDAKKFVPGSDEAPRDQRNLVLPVGLRGVVSKVINTNEVSSNFPIQVKFAPGQNNGEGFDPPVVFRMHFGSDEVESL